MKTLIIFLFVSATAWCNTCLSAGTGNWNDSTKWTNCGGGVPGSGDTAKIAQGQTITIPAGYHAIVGLSAPASAQAGATSTTLSGAITSTGQTAITVASGATIANNQYVIINAEGANTTEIVQVTAGGGTTSLTIVRAQQGTAASLHASGAAVFTGAIPAISCNGTNIYGADGTGILKINGWLTFRGNVEQCVAVWTVGPGAIIEHDSSAAAAPSSTNYRWYIGAWIFPDAARLTARGISGNRVTIRNATSSGRFRGFTTYYGATQGSGQFDFEYVNIDGCGTSAVPCTDANSHQAGTAFLARCDHCLVTNSGQVKASLGNGGNSTTSIRFSNTTITSTVDGNGYALAIVPTSTGDVDVNTIYTDGMLVIGGGGGGVYNSTHFRNIFLRALTNGKYPVYLGGATFRVAEFDLVLRMTDVIGGASSGTYANIPGGTVTRLMCLINSNLNPHCFSGPNGNATPDDVVDGGWFENLGAGLDGDIFGGSGANLTTIKNTVSPCNVATGVNMSLKVVGLPTTKTFALENNTYCGADDGAGSARGFGFEVPGTAPVGLLASAKNNIVFCATSRACYLVHQGPTGTDSVGTYANVDYNWKWNVSTGPYFQQSGTPYTSYNPNPPGAHDSSGDPQFVQQRHFLDWCQMLKPSISDWTGCVAEFAKMNDDVGYDSRFTIRNAYNWLRDGYRPQNPALMNAGDTGGRVGAMDAYGTPSLVVGPGKLAGPAVIK